MISKCDFLPFGKLVAVAFLSIACICNAAASNDALAPKSKVEDALALPLHTATIATVSLQQSLLFYRDALGLAVKGPITLTDKQTAQQRQLWQLPKDLNWQTYHLFRKGVPEAINIQLLVLDKAMPSIHDSWDSTELGPFSLGFPNTDTIALDKTIRDTGFGALNALESYPIPRPDGSTYQIDETIFNGPDFLHGVAITRGGGMAQLGPIDGNGLGGPAYSAQIIEDSEQHLKFYTDVLGLEIRSDREFKSAGDKGAMNLPNGTVFRFAIVYSKGATTGHMLFVDFRNLKPKRPKNSPSLPNLGLGMWTYPVTDIKQVITNAKQFGSDIVQMPIDVNSPIYGKASVATLRAPNGFLIEVFEAK
ncbi:extradiol dioxygenase [Thalassotalea sp. M1531]|uniref:Extradiol dioxygenase n=1 Tax=Thalassotalea algicola TaxID=2716224 RepID=A0A7Y0L8U5_9GAMM|nr:extradiol dioxygenase [Thalassotalea algicola]NMP30099.1 extradiol dioxygenase [Thalassotalea algicola]